MKQAVQPSVGADAEKQAELNTGMKVWCERGEERSRRRGRTAAGIDQSPQWMIRHVGEKRGMKGGQ